MNREPIWKLTVRLYPKSFHGSCVRQPSCVLRNSVAMAQDSSVDPVSPITQQLMCGATDARHRSRLPASFFTIMLRQGFGKTISLGIQRAAQGDFLISEAGQNKQMRFLPGALAAGCCTSDCTVVVQQASS